jgi:hypothetical protein
MGLVTEPTAAKTGSTGIVFYILLLGLIIIVILVIIAVIGMLSSHDTVQDTQTDALNVPVHDTPEEVPLAITTSSPTIVRTIKTVSCTSGKEMCGNTCADLKTDRNYCGSCTTVCPEEKTCRQGNCVLDVTVPPREGQGPSSTSFTPQDLAYFKEIALGYEYGGAPAAVYRWNKDTVTIRVHGNPDADATSCLNSVIADFNALSAHSHLALTESNSPDIHLYFAPEPEFSSILPSYSPVNMGYFANFYDGDCGLSHGTVLISTTGLSSRERCHLIREEVTQNMGLARDSERYTDSIFYIGWTDETQYSAEDRHIIQMLYNTDVPACADAAEVDTYFS